MSITVKYGAGNSLTLNPEVDETWGDVLESERVSIGLGLPEDTSRIAVQIDGIEVPVESAIQDGVTASLITRANQKG